MHLSRQSRVPLLTAIRLGAAAVCAQVALGTPAPRVVIQSFSAAGRERPLVLLPPRSEDEIGGRQAEFRRYDPVRLPVTAQALDFRLGPNPAMSDLPARIQFRLEGWDDDWRDMEGVMWLSVRFLDEGGRRISSAALPRAGQSPGWTGNPHTSPFRVKSETVVPPPRARQLQIFLAAGGPRTMGIWLVKALRAVATPEGGTGEKVLLDARIERGDDLHDPRGVPAGWRREGTNSSIPQLFTLRTSPPRHALSLIDTDMRSTGRWLTAGDNLVPVEPGVPVRIETEEAFSIGASGSYACSYHKLPAGRYTFRAIPVDEFGMPAGLGVQLPLTLVPPFYATGWFWGAAALVGVAGVGGGVRYTTRRRLQRELAAAERRHAVEAERMRIAQDLHDDMGARLTQMSLASGLALRHTPADSTAYGDLKRFDRAAREMVIALDEIVWAVNPAHDTLEGLGNYVSQYVTEVTAESALRCRLEIPALLSARFVSSGVRHHVLMALKEAITNALKHSAATEVRVRLSFNDPLLVLTVADDGRGFDPAAAPAGNGIANTQRRLAAAGGACEVRSAAGAGTTVTLTLRLEPPPP